MKTTTTGHFDSVIKTVEKILGELRGEEREVDAAHPQPVDVTGWVEAQSAVESASETHGDAIE